MVKELKEMDDLKLDVQIHFIKVICMCTKIAAKRPKRKSLCNCASNWKRVA